MTASAQHRSIGVSGSREERTEAGTPRLHRSQTGAHAGALLSSRPPARPPWDDAERLCKRSARDRLTLQPPAQPAEEQLHAPSRAHQDGVSNKLHHITKQTQSTAASARGTFPHTRLSPSPNSALNLSINVRKVRLIQGRSEAAFNSFSILSSGVKGDKASLCNVVNGLTPLRFTHFRNAHFVRSRSLLQALSSWQVTADTYPVLWTDSYRYLWADSLFHQPERGTGV